MEISVKELVRKANEEVYVINAEQAIELLNKNDVLFVDVRDFPELKEEGKIPGAIHASRGMLEFYIDPETPYYLPEIHSNKLKIFYCKSSGRSALAAQRAQEMGLKDVAHMAGGFNAWKESGGPVAEVK